MACQILLIYLENHQRKVAQLCASSTLLYSLQSPIQLSKLCVSMNKIILQPQCMNCTVDKTDSILLSTLRSICTLAYQAIYATSPSTCTCMDVAWQCVMPISVWVGGAAEAPEGQPGKWTIYPTVPWSLCDNYLETMAWVALLVAYYLWIINKLKFSPHVHASSIFKS